MLIKSRNTGAKDRLKGTIEYPTGIKAAFTIKERP